MKLLLLLSPLLAVASAQDCFLPGKCDDIPTTFTTTSDQFDCLDYCKAQSGCNWFSWFSDTVCIAYSSCSSVSQNCGDADLTCVYGQKECVVAEPVCDVPGQCQSVPVGTSIAADKDDCLVNHCKPNLNCQWFTFDPTSTICLLFATCDTLDVTNCPECVSGENECDPEPEPNCWFAGQCLAVPVANSVESDQDGCLRKCKDNANCEYFTFDSNSGICILFPNCDDVDVSCTSCVSGDKDCELSTGGTTSGTSPTGSPTGTPPPSGDYGNVVVLGGYEADRELDDVESFSLDGTSDCGKPPKLPAAAKELAAGYVEGKLTVCGGSGSGGSVLQTTHVLNGGSWTAGPNMGTARAFHAAVVTGEGWWVLGGLGNGGAKLKTTELFRAGAWTAGPDLPEALLGMCAVMIDATKTLVAGGSSDAEGFSRKSYVYDWSSGTWSNSGDMNVAKMQHGCVVVDGEVISAGGTGSVGALRAVEAYSAGTWRSLADLPFGLQAPAVVVADGKATVVGGLGSPDGYSEDFVQYSGTAWTVLSSPKLSTARYEHDAVSVPDEALSNCK